MERETNPNPSLDLRIEKTTARSGAIQKILVEKAEHRHPRINEERIELKIKKRKRDGNSTQ